MGLINWLKDKRFTEVMHDIKMLKTDIEAVNVRIDILQTKFNSLNGRVNRQKGEDVAGELEQLREFFGLHQAPQSLSPMNTYIPNEYYTDNKGESESSLSQD